jgi:hypothetical protein
MTIQRHKSYEKQSRRLMGGVLPVIISLLLFPQTLFAGDIEDLFTTTKTAYVALETKMAADLVTIEADIDNKMKTIKTDITNAGETLKTDLSTIAKPVKDISDTVLTAAIAELKTKIDDATTKLTKAKSLKKDTVKALLSAANASIDVANATCNIDVTQFDITDSIVDVYKKKKSEVVLTLSFLDKQVTWKNVEWQFDKSKDNIDTVVENIKSSDPFKIPTMVIP